MKCFLPIASGLLAIHLAAPVAAAQGIRARDLGIPFDGVPGALNAITDVLGVEVGHVTVIRGNGPLVKGEGPVRTGVTAILPRERRLDPVYAAWYALNGNGEMTDRPPSGRSTREILNFPEGRRFDVTDPSDNELAVWSELSSAVPTRSRSPTHGS